MHNKKTSTLYSLWLPITDFKEFTTNIKEEVINSSSEYSQYREYENTAWTWLKFSYKEIRITIDSLGFIYIDNVSSLEMLDKVLHCISKNLNEKTVLNIEDTFLNKQIGYKKEISESSIFKFIKHIIVEIEPVIHNLKFEFISSFLRYDENIISESNSMKFSLKESEEKFQTILNRNFQKLLDKGIFFTNSLLFDNGEIYDLSITQNVDNFIKVFPELELKVNGKTGDKKDYRKLYIEIVKKAIQDTLEERVILHFLKVTKVEYLSQIIYKISDTNEILKKLNSYLLEDIDKDSTEYMGNLNDLDDESAVEIFIQNLLQSIPKFHMMDTKLREAYYIKVGNTTTNLKVQDDETLKNTLFYTKWKSSINFFIETAIKAKESLNMYHQNKTLKELEDISYNANYQADIEDIRELQKRKDWSLDEKTRRYFDKLVIAIGIITLSAEAPIWNLVNKLNVFENLKYVIYNALSYFVLFVSFYCTFRFKKCYGSIRSSVKNFWNHCIVENKKIKYKFFRFDKADYDKHEHRSSRSIYSYNKSEEKYEKIPIFYNNRISTYELVKRLKEKKVTQIINGKDFTFDIFPKLLKETPIDSKKTHEYRENYRISGNDKVATKIMYRYKISDLKLSKMLEYMENDLFLKNYNRYLGNDYDIDKAIEYLKKVAEVKPLNSEEVDENGEKKGTELTLYIVYSFVLKFQQMDDSKKIYTYNISKDQFRVHYHINKIYYPDLDDSSSEYIEFEKALDNLAKLIDIYFLARLKKID